MVPREWLLAGGWARVVVNLGPSKFLVPTKYSTTKTALIQVFQWFPSGGKLCSPCCADHAEGELEKMGWFLKLVRLDERRQRAMTKGPCPRASRVWYWQCLYRYRLPPMVPSLPSSFLPWDKLALIGQR